MASERGLYRPQRLLTGEPGGQAPDENDVPTPEHVLSGLDTSLYRRLIYLPETGSTNDVAREHARAGAPEGTIIVADRQTRGRGRRGRAWASPAGSGLWFSVLLRPAIPPKEAPLLAFLAAAAVREAVAALGAPVLLKWPNDVVAAGGGKLAGILVEMDAVPDRVRHCVVGIGVNVNQCREDFPPEVRMEATSVRLLTGRVAARVPLLRAILTGLAARYRQALSTGFGPLLEEVRRHSATLGAHVRVMEMTGESWEGLAVAIQDDGALLVQPDDGGAARAVYAADVSVRAADGARTPAAARPSGATPQRDDTGGGDPA